MTPYQRARYLALLQLPPAPPSLPALQTLVTAHLARLPFENVSKLVRAHRGLPPGLPSIEEFLEAAEEDGTAATCYRQNGALHELLWGLDYDASLVAADMDRPDVHAAVTVKLDGWRYLVDVGYGAPLFAPLPLDDVEPVQRNLGNESYVLHPADRLTGRSRLDHLRGGEVVHGYTLKPEARRLADFAPAIADSFRPDAMFLNRLRIIRHTPARSVSLRDFTAVITAAGGQRTLVLEDRGRLLDFVVSAFGIRRAVAAEACDALAERGHAAFA